MIDLQPAGIRLSTREEAGTGRSGKHRLLCRLLWLGVAAALLMPATVRAEPDHLPVDQVKIGMTGYGMTVFHGTKIEPFRVEVVSVMRDFGPRRSVIWVRCPDPRMQKTGPVSGMSGSPIYLWADGEEGIPGHGGRLIGAFAFGYGLAKDCYVGVQPIGHMMETASRVNTDEEAEGEPNAAEAEAADENRPAPPPRARFDGVIRRVLETQPEQVGGRSYALMALQERWYGEAAGAEATTVPSPVDDSRRVASMALPVPIADARLMPWLGPALRQCGLMPVAMGESGVTGNPPSNINTDAVRIEPGSVLAVPLAWGDADLAAVGTATEVLDDGRVLAFGHAMYGQGESNWPMATGYVHFIQPSLTTSFKLGGSLALQGTVVRDEQAAIVGRPGQDFTSAPVKVNVTLPGDRQHAYNYRVLHHRSLTPMLVSAVIGQSLFAEQGLPPLSTMHVSGQIQFEGDRTLPLQSTIPGGGYGAIWEVSSAIAALSQNPYQHVKVTGVEIDVTIEDQLKQLSLVNARITDPIVHPGDLATIDVWLQAFEEEPFRRRITLPIPADLPPGEYPLQLVGGDNYHQMRLRSRPHLTQTRNVDDIFELLKLTGTAQGNRLHVILPRPEPELAVGRTEMPDLPSSRQVLIATASSATASAYQRWIESSLDLPMTVQAQTQLTLIVQPKNPSSGS
ncbi:MAG: hypothetical protein R3336_00485 [Phycisphaeraceae bacterium]|nr:hypothetical protein [Phycisphaeraceae bacterium]